MTNSQGTPTMKISRHFRARIYFALAGMLLSGIAISLGTGAAEPAPATQSSVSDSKAEVRAFAIRSADGPKIKTLIKAIWETWPPAEGFERKV
ncbi:hypothetical protein HYR69_11160, partial [Candidatus Sumerlaeota bacterium]|nr:hypothetical protein [Candidatus Sumerlaeota bacterium]